MADRIHITTAIHYSNGPPHLGHAYEAIVADTFARHYRRKLGKGNVTFVTGTDEHGQKNRDAAVKAGKSPREFVDGTSTLFKEAFATLEISYDKFVRTTDDTHKKFVQRMLTLTKERGDIYFKDYEGLYCVGCERFYTEKELLPGNVCPVHKQPVETVREGNYFLKLEKHRAAILKRIAEQPDFIRPERYKNEALQMLTEPLEDLCISRPKSRLDWGIELPFDDKYVTYVWYDAFCAYLSELEDTSIEALSQVLPTTHHFIGKDILKTHAVYWPSILLAAGLPLYGHLNVHGFLNFGGERLSKSAGNIVDPMALANKYGPDVLRYFVLREFVYGLDGDFTEDRIVERYNADLANGLGNLTSRVLTMATKYFGGEITAEFPPPSLQDTDFYEYPGSLGSIVDSPPSYQAKAAAFLECLHFKGTLDLIWERVGAADHYIVVTAPFTLAKDQTKLPEVAKILANLVEGLRLIAVELEPYMPKTSWRILELLNLDEATARAPYREAIKSGHRVKPAIPLFPRIEKKAPSPVHPTAR
ncbi:MAG TPA: methionine--tRNA ligase [Candidatus Binataceae bacterium]|nr:methionine--tRNA ligase [Candidatus Binataceae bacterium]